VRGTLPPRPAPPAERGAGVTGRWGLGWGVGDDVGLPRRRAPLRNDGVAGFADGQPGDRVTGGEKRGYRGRSPLTGVWGVSPQAFLSKLGAEQPEKDAQKGNVYEIAPHWLRLGEPPRDPLSEADLSLVWQGQRFPPEALTTADGRAVEVVNPGRHGGGSGPDFLDAVVRLDGVERRGDVELHVRASSFRGHGHDRDAAYANLALHVVYEADELETRLQNGALAPVAAFAPWLAGRAQELESWLQAPEIWQEPCRGVTTELGEDAVRAALAVAGQGRFETRVRRMEQEIVALGAEEALWRALLDTLGVGGDREGFRRLAAAFPASLAEGVRDLEASLAYVAGLGPAPQGEDVALPSPLQPPLRSFGRPANRPGLRLAGLVALVRRAIRQSGVSASEPLAVMAMASVADRAGNPGTIEPLNQSSRNRGFKGSVGQLVAAWSAPPQIGPGRARELLVNAVLPFASAGGLPDRAAEALRRLPAAPTYGRTAFLEANLRPAKGRVARNALQSQGLLGYVAQWCSQGGCGRCPLSEDRGQRSESGRGE